MIFALIRAFTRQSMSTLGNVLGRSATHHVMGASTVALLIALFFIQQGALQNFLPYQAVNTVKERNSCCRSGASSFSGSDQDVSVLTAVASLMPTRRIRLKTQPH